MKHYRQIFYALGGVLVLTLGILVFLVYQSGVEGRERYKMKAESLLKSTAELWVNHELDKLRIPYSFGGGEPAAQNGMRRMILADKEIAVKVDSVKESKLLFNSRALNAKSNLLILINDSSIFVLDKQWRENLQAVQLPDDCALELFNEQLDDAINLLPIKIRAQRYREVVFNGVAMLRYAVRCIRWVAILRNTKMLRPVSFIFGWQCSEIRCIFKHPKISGRQCSEIGSKQSPKWVHMF